MDDLQSVLQKADAQLIAVDTLYGADLELQRSSPTLRGKIRGFLESERAALDHLARQVVAATGSGETHVHYPLAPWEAGFEASIDKNMPGVREARPDIASTIARHQPYSSPGLARLRELLQDEKRQQLTPETKPAPEEAEAPEPAPAPEPPPTPAPPPPQGGLGAGLTGPMFINGVEYDPVTLKPIHPPPVARRDTIYVDWLFTLDGGPAPALPTLQSIQAAVATAIDEVRGAAGL
jgi:hypothetical protein